MTSAKDKDGNRILQSEAGEKIQKEVLNAGHEYFSENVSIEADYVLWIFYSGISAG